MEQVVEASSMQKPFLENYERVIKIFDEEFDYIKENLCGNLGWVDVWMPMYYFLCGKQV